MKKVIVEKIRDIYIPGYILKDENESKKIYYLVLTRPTPYGMSKTLGHYAVDMVEWDASQETPVNGVFSVDIKERNFLLVAQLNERKFTEVASLLKEKVG